MDDRLIYSSIPSTDYVEDIMAGNPGMQSDDALMLAYDMIAEDRETLCREFAGIRGHFVIYGSAGRWDGRHGGFTPLMDTTLEEALLELSAFLPDTDSEVSVYVSPDGDITARKAHHDGVNLYTLRELGREYGEEELEEIAAAEGGSGKWFEKNAKPCGHYIAELFRWED